MKESFVTIKIKVSVANKFRSYSRGLSRSQSELLRAMLEFFELHLITPYQYLGPNMSSIEKAIMKRFNSVIAIIKDIEKTQTKPVSVQMDLLFEGQTKKRDRPKRVEKIFASQANEEKELKTIAKVHYDRAKSDLVDMKAEFAYVMNRVNHIKNNFGKDYLKLELSLSEFQTIWASLKDD